MQHLVHHVHCACQEHCAPGAVDGAPHVRKVWGMPRAKKRPEQPRELSVTFLRAYRKKAGFNQEKAAARFGIDRTTLGRIERGEVPYNPPLLKAAARLYGCTRGDLLDRDPNAPPLPPPLSTPILEAIGLLTAEQQALLIEMAKTFKKAG